MVGLGGKKICVRFWDRLESKLRALQDALEYLEAVEKLLQGSDKAMKMLEVCG